MKTATLGVGVLPLLGLACALSQPGDPRSDLDSRVATAAAQTVTAMPSPTAPPTAIPLPSATPSPTLAPPTLAPTATPTDLPTHTPTTTATTIACDWAAFVQDISVPDGTRLRAGENFTKTWRLRNIGGCTWGDGYSLVFASGDRMDGPTSVRLEKAVAPGKTVDVSVRLEAPEKPGEYRGYWQLRGRSGVLFGIGPSASKPIWVDIRVARPAKTVYRFVEEVCQAAWATDDGALPCPGTAGAAEGFVVRLDAPPLEGDRLENEAGLWTRPPTVGDGWIRGEYPEFQVEKGDRFRAVVACRSGAAGCNVKFLLQYRLGSGSIQVLDDWSEKTDGSFTAIDIDLSALAGKKVRFILAVDTRGDPADDDAIWVQPRIVR